MKKSGILFIVVCLLGLTVVPVMGGYLVKTTFEKESAGYQTWDTSVSDVWDELDIASGINWVANDNSKAIIATSRVWKGGQAGRVTGNKYAKLEFGNGSKTGTYVVKWYQLNQIQDSNTGDRHSNVWIIDDDVDEATQVTMNADGNTISVHTADGVTTVLSNMKNDSWYEFELTLNYQTKKFDIKAKEANDVSWVGTLNDANFVSSDSDSFDRIYCRAASNKIFGFFDDITVQVLPSGGVIDLVGTTFEVNSGGAGTWPADDLWGDGNDPDPISTDQWYDFQGDANGIVTASGASHDASAAGKIWRTATSPYGTVVALNFDDGNNVGIYTMKWWQKYEYAGSTKNNYVRTIIGSDIGPNTGTWANIALAITMGSDNTGAATEISVNCGTIGGSKIAKTLLSNYNAGSWYGFEAELNFVNKTFDVKVRELGESKWEGMVDGYLRNADISDSFDWIQCKVDQTGANGYWDDFEVSLYGCGGYGYKEGDFNQDCYVDFKDFAAFSQDWVECSDPNDANCVRF
ncbi:MAG: hypothetical protein K8R02_09290 [Anaerohalosphaeraceae bacterium]|nr:hypothetical protein [Anaerohalosphaeraceae bacterium]